MPSVVIFEEKHGNRYYLLKDGERAEVDEAMARIAYTVLKERFEDGYWYPTMEQVQEDKKRTIARTQEDVKEKYGEFTDLTEDEVNALPESLRTKAVEARQKAAKHLRRAEVTHSDEEWFAAGLERLMALPIDEAVKVYDGETRRRRLATSLLDFRNDFQYEGYETDYLEEV